MGIRYNNADNSLNGVLMLPTSHNKGKSPVTVKMLVLSVTAASVISIIISVAITLPLSRTYIMSHTSFLDNSRNSKEFQGNVNDLCVSSFPLIVKLILFYC